MNIEFKLHARAASCSDVSRSPPRVRVPRSSIISFSRSLRAEVARSKTISQLEAGSEFTERCHTGGGAQVRCSSRIVGLR